MKEKWGFIHEYYRFFFIAWWYEAFSRVPRIAYLSAYISSFVCLDKTACLGHRDGMLVSNCLLANKNKQDMHGYLHQNKRISTFIQKRWIQIKKIHSTIKFLNMVIQPTLIVKHQTKIIFSIVYFCASNIIERSEQNLRFTFSHHWQHMIVLQHYPSEASQTLQRT